MCSIERPAANQSRIQPVVIALVSDLTASPGTCQCIWRCDTQAGVGASDPFDCVADDSGDGDADVGVVCVLARRWDDRAAAVEREVDAMFGTRRRRRATRLPGELPCVM
jgi:hypothetical protein